MGIGNTTAASAVVAALTGAAPARVTGPGTGVAGPTLRRKVAVVRRMLAVNRPDPADPLDVLRRALGHHRDHLAGGRVAHALDLVPTSRHPPAVDEEFGPLQHSRHLENHLKHLLKKETQTGHEKPDLFRLSESLFTAPHHVTPARRVGPWAEPGFPPR